MGQVREMFSVMKNHQSFSSQSESEELAFGAGAISEALEANKSKLKKQTIKIKLPRKPAAPRSSVLVKNPSPRVALNQ
jgi:hypothetical protein